MARLLSLVTGIVLAASSCLAADFGVAISQSPLSTDCDPTSPERCVRTWTDAEPIEGACNGIRIVNETPDDKLICVSVDRLESKHGVDAVVCAQRNQFASPDRDNTGTDAKPVPGGNIVQTRIVRDAQAIAINGGIAVAGDSAFAIASPNELQIEHNDAEIPTRRPIEIRVGNTVVTFRGSDFSGLSISCTRREN